jgi:TolB-like protein/cytochrome c-type biogenesis protein CcmH/NrfG
MGLTLSLFGPFEARLDGKVLPVTSRRSQAMLAMLARAPKHAVTRDRMAATLWTDRNEDQARASLRQELSSLRRTLGEASDILTADATCIRIDAARLDPETGSSDMGDFLEGLDLRSEPFDDWRREESARSPQPENAPAQCGDENVATQIFEQPSVLIMGFVPASAAEEDASFATGLVVDLRTSISLWRWFPVIGPEAIGWKTERDGDLRDIATSVGAAYAIGGTIRRAGARVRVTASLTETGTGHLLWSETFDGEMTDIFEMQEAIGRAVVARVAPEIGHAEATRILRQRPANMTAWQLVAQTDELERTGGEGYGTHASNLAQVPLLEEAIRLEPDYARAWGRLGRYYFRGALQGWIEDREAAFEKALELCRRAVECDPTEWEAQAYLALTMIFGTQAYGPARFHAFEAVRLNPSAPLARHACGCLLEWIGEPETALEHLHALFDLNPNHTNRAAVLGDITTCQMFVGQMDKAVETARQIRDIAPDYARGLQRVVVTLGMAGMTEEAGEVLARVLELQPDFDESYLRSTYPYAKAEHADMIVEGFRRAGWNG